MTARSLFLLLALALADCGGADSCTPGAQQPCAVAYDGGATQQGYQACGARGTWSACVPVGACAGAGAMPVYSRCASQSDCGPEGCAVCGHYNGVMNPEAHSVCYAYCQADAECAPTTYAQGVTARCLLGQCALLCTASSVCPRDARCLPWASASVANAYPGFTGLCE